MFATVSNSHLPQFMSPIPEPRTLAVDARRTGREGRCTCFHHFPCSAKLRTTQEAEVILIAPWWPKQRWIPTPTLSLCQPSVVLSMLPRSPVTTGSEIRLRRKVVPSACMEALVRNYKAAGEVSRLPAAPRRPSTNRMYDDRWLRFTPWAAGQGFDLLSPTAAQIASFLYIFSLIHMVCLPKLLKATGPVWAQCLTELAKQKWFCTRPSPI